MSWTIYADPVHLNIPSVPLPEAVEQITQSSGANIDYNDIPLPNYQVAALDGEYDVKTVLDQVLEKGNMTAVETEQNRYVIQLAQADNTSNMVADATTMPEVTVTAEGARSPYNKSYTRAKSVTATRTDVSIMDTPFSVQVVPRQVLQDQQIVRLVDALQNVSGVTFFNNSVSGQDGFIIRGFNTSAHFRNGVSMPRNNNNRTEVANIAQIEVLKGPASIMFGRTDAGGIVNIVTKQPLKKAYYSLQQQAGSFDFYRTAVDAGGPLINNDALLYRFNLSYENSDTFRDHIDYKSVFVAPVVQWNISPATQVTLEMEYQSINMDPGATTVHVNERPAKIPRSRVLNEPSFNANKGNRYFGGVNWSHKFNENWQIKHQLSTEHTLVPHYRGVIPSGAGKPNGDVSRFIFDTNTKVRRYQSMLNLEGKVTTGFMKHTLLAGYDYFHQTNFFDDQVCCPGDTINAFNPVYFSELPPAVFDPANDLDVTKTSQEWHGAYFQDQIELPYGIYIMGGFRYDDATNRNRVTNNVTGKDSRFSPRGGLVWKPVPWVSLYGSYSENFGVSNRRNSNGSSLPPEIAQQWEMGLKTEWFDGRLNASFAYFELTKQNISTADPANPRFSRALGEAETRGYEFDVKGEVMPGWNVIATYMYMPFAKITKDRGTECLVEATGDSHSSECAQLGITIGDQGNRLFLASKHTGSFWSTYEFQQPMLRGLKIAGGIQAVGKRAGNASNTHTLPYYVIGYLMASYQFNVKKFRVTTQLNVYNVSDEKYFSSARNNMITIGAPRTLMGMLRIEH